MALTAADALRSAAAEQYVGALIGGLWGMLSGTPSAAADSRRRTSASGGAEPSRGHRRRPSPHGVGCPLYKHGKPARGWPQFRRSPPPSACW